MSNTVDVAILGAGPAGCAAAIQLARAGLSVLVIEKEAQCVRRLGETLPPIATQILKSLQVWQQFLALNPVPAARNASAWGSSELTFNDFLFAVDGCGWHIDRACMERMLRDAAQAAGATLLHNAHVLSADSLDRGWILDLSIAEKHKRYRADFLVDATGQSRSCWRPGITKRLQYDNLIGVAFYMRRANVAMDAYTLVETVDDGWFYATQFTSQDAVICYMTDADLYAGRRKQSYAYWARQLSKTVHMRAEFSEAKPVSGPIFASASTSIRLNLAGQNWMAIGDAAMSYDPLSSLGITKALRSGIDAARSIVALQNSQKDAVIDWANDIRNSFASYLKTRKAYYALEQRWPESAFWARRRSSVDDSPRLTPGSIGAPL